MRSIWKGAISFGLVNVPVRLYSATEDHDLSLHQVHDADGGRIRYQRRCEVCGKVVDYAHIDKAYDDGNTTVVLTEDDLKSLPEERSREIEVVEFVPSDQVDPIMFDRSYFLEPDKTAVKAYALLRRALAETDRTAIVQFSLRQKTRLGALRVRDKVLMLQSLLWDDEVREADFPSLDETVRVSAKEAEMASSLVENMGADFAPEKFSDDYQAQLRELIAAKLEQGDALDTAATFGDDDAGEPEGGQVVDLMEALRRSVEENRAKRGRGSGSGSGSSTPAEKTAAASTTKKSTTKKSPSTKTAAKKTPAKKTPAKKTPATKTAAKKSTAKKSTAKKAAAGRSEERKSA
jgi:DNA end-binding protein Ku